MAQPPHRISDSVLNAENRISTVTDTHLSSPTLCSTSPLPNLKSQCSDPFQPTTWQGSTSVVHRPQRWQLASSMPSKTTKMLLRFHHPTTMVGKSHTSSEKGLDSSKPSLPKGWVYAVEEVHAEVKTKVVDPNQYLMLDAPLTCLKRKRAEQLDDPYRQHCQASNITEALHTSLSVSKKMAMKHWRITSRPILMRLTPL
jgi:hypothetical protein